MSIKGLGNFNLKQELDKKMKNLIKNSKEILEVGFFENSKYQNGTNVASVAKFHEYGTINIPARPFFRLALKNEKKWLDYFKITLIQNNNLNLTLLKLGELTRGDIVKSITQLSNPPLKASTIKRKGSSKPLIDTGFLRANVNFRIKNQ